MITLVDECGDQCTIYEDVGGRVNILVNGERFIVEDTALDEVCREILSAGGGKMPLRVRNEMSFADILAEMIEYGSS